MTAVAHDLPTNAEHMDSAAIIPGNCNAWLTDGSGRRCKNGAGKGCPDHYGYGACYKHGGRTPASRKHGREMAAEAALQRLAEGQAQPVQDPIGELSRLAGDMRADYQAARRLVAELTEQERLVTQGFGAVAPDVDPLVKLWERASERLHRILAEMAKLGFTERRIEIDQQTSQVLMTVIAGFLTEQGIDPVVAMPRLGSMIRAIETGGEETP